MNGQATNVCTVYVHADAQWPEVDALPADLCPILAICTYLRYLSIMVPLSPPAASDFARTHLPLWASLTVLRVDHLILPGEPLLPLVHLVELCAGAIRFKEHTRAGPPPQFRLERLDLLRFNDMSAEDFTFLTSTSHKSLWDLEIMFLTSGRVLDISPFVGLEGLGIYIEGFDVAAEAKNLVAVLSQAPSTLQDLVLGFSRPSLAVVTGWELEDLDFLRAIPSSVTHLTMNGDYHLPPFSPGYLSRLLLGEPHTLPHLRVYEATADFEELSERDKRRWEKNVSREKRGFGQRALLTRKVREERGLRLRWEYR